MLFYTLLLVTSAFICESAANCPTQCTNDIAGMLTDKLEILELQVTRLQQKLRNTCSCCGPSLSHAAPICPNGWLQFNNSCWLYVSERVNWAQANQFCRRDSAFVASIHSYQENVFASRLSSYNADISCLVKIRGKKLIINNQSVPIDAATESQCLQHCREAEIFRGFKCLSMLYYLDSHECILNEANSLTNSLSDSECSDQVNYYENQCDNNSTSSESSCIKAIIDQQLVAGIGAKLIQVDNLTDCQQKCIEAEIVHSDGFRCASAIYYKSRQSCLLNADIQLIPRKPQSNSDIIQFLNNCPTISSNDSTEIHCNMQAMDLLFLIDGSGSFGEKNFLQLKSFLKLIVEELDMGGQSRMALIQFDHEVELEFDFDSYRSKEALKAIDKVKYKGGWTKTGKALQFAMDRLLKNRSTSNPLYVIVTTDGESQDDPQPPADLIRQMGAQTFAIGITDAIGDAQLLSIAGSVDRVSKLVDFAQLDYQFMSNFRQQICIPISITSELGPWIGLSDLELENRFQWTDSSDLDYQNWLKARPSNRSNTHKCVQFDKNSTTAWSEAPCTAKRTFICRKPIGLQQT